MKDEEKKAVELTEEQAEKVAGGLIADTDDLPVDPAKTMEGIVVPVASDTDAIKVKQKKAKRNFF